MVKPAKGGPGPASLPFSPFFPHVGRPTSFSLARPSPFPLSSFHSHHATESTEATSRADKRAEQVADAMGAGGGR